VTIHKSKQLSKYRD